ncbi:uncharacterized protein EDB93DRAFT_1249874 [Suillus bovinus]|uniref:uncharacterized protein n=1 Tax=Suillus bovinus TaxID=48563 RepID=UPI001B8711BD|nr:uncharacterized protein EDB93DRAFT_1249874 [Suillus bovinus]KAG2150311.1 hypothetical protein EDB93DRAFT_1249874 [Suillus bovinus]
MSQPRKNINNKSSTPPPITNITIHQMRRPAPPQEDIEAMPSIVMNIENAKEYLNKNLLCHIDQPFTLTHLISALFHITQLKSVPLPAIEAIRAVTFILKKHEANELADKILKQITDALTLKIAEHIVAAIAPQVVKILSTSEHLDETLKEAEWFKYLVEREKEEKDSEKDITAEHFKEAANTLHNSMEECNKSLKELSPTINKVNELLNDFPQISPTLIPSPESTQQKQK